MNENNEAQNHENQPLRIIQTENPEKEIWKMLGYFESEKNAKDFLLEKLPQNCEIDELSKNLSIDMQVAEEYFRAAQSVSLLTRPLLIYYGMINIAKVVHISCEGKIPEGKKHGLVTVKPWNFVLADLSVKIKQYGIFPEFYHCYSREELHTSVFSLKHLLSQIPEVKVAFETVYKEKSLALKVVKARYGVSIVDSELEKYTGLNELLANIPKLKKHSNRMQMFDDHAFLFAANWDNENQYTPALSGEKFLILPIKCEDGTFRLLNELSTHFLIMFMLGMTARYHPKVWADAIKGEESGDIYVIQNFLDVTTRKFPNLILNELRNRKFIFSTPRIAVNKTGLTEEQLEQAYEYVNRKFVDSMRGY